MPRGTFLYRTSGRSLLSNMAAVRFNSPEPTTPCMNGTCCSTTSLLRALPDRANSLRRLPARRGMSSHNAGSDRKHLRPRGPEADLLPVYGISDRAVAEQQYHQPSARSLREANCRAEERRLARPRSKKNPTPASETAGSGALRLAFSTRWRRCSCRRWAMGCVTNTASSNRPSKTAGSMNSRTTGCVGKIPGRSLVPTKWSKSNSTALSRWSVDNCAPYPAGPPR